MSFSNMFSTLAMFPDVDRWVSVLNKNVQGASLPGFRATRTTFNGSPGTPGVSRNPATMRPSGQAQISLSPSAALDMTQGLIQATGKDSNYAIAGDGFFVLEDRYGQLYYTRFGEFSEGDNGTLLSKEGLSVVTRSRAVELGLYDPVPVFDYLTTPPTAQPNAVRLIDRGLADWQYASTSTAVNSGGQSTVWFPYASGTAYDESAAWHYKSQDIALKKTFSLGDDLPTSATISLESDDWTYLYINGHLLTKEDTTTGTEFGNFNVGGPTSGIWTTGQNGQPTKSVYDVSKYLRAGINQITAYSMEDVILDGVRINASFNDVNGNAISTDGADATTNKWMTKIIGQAALENSSQTSAAVSATDSIIKSADLSVASGSYIAFDSVLNAPIWGNTATITQGLTTFTQGTDYDIIDNQTIAWISGGSRPVATSTFEVTYDHMPAEPGPSNERYDAVFERGVSDLAIARFAIPSKLKYSKFGPHLLEATTDAGSRNFEFSSTADTAKVRRGFIEQANTTIKRETYELALAQKMYDAITSLMQLQLKSVDTGLNIIK